MRKIDPMSLFLACFICLTLSCSDESSTPTPSTTTPPAGPSTTEYPGIPKYIWPLETAQNENSILINYYDANKNTGFSDYNCGGTHGYDGHLGVDIAIFNFRVMDEGIAVIASAPGVVSQLEVSKHDRVYWTPYTDSGNFVTISYSDGSRTVYYHLRTNSVTVKLGELVKRGQVIGYVGSSGATPFPHLHLETKVLATGGGFTSIDPYAGNCNDIVSLWEQQPEHVGNQPLLILDAGTFTDFEYEGEYQYGEIKTLKDRPSSPAVYGLNEGKLGIWTQFQGNAGNIYTVRVSKPDGSVFKEETRTLEQKRRYGWHAMNWDLSSVSAIDFGHWKADILVNGELKKEFNFELGSETEMGPRFYPLAGSSVIIGQGASTIPLTIIGDEPGASLSIQDASSGVTLSGSTLIIPASSAQVYRNHHVKVIATDSKGRTDFYSLHLIDLSKPFKE